MTPTPKFVQYLQDRAKERLSELEPEVTALKAMIAAGSGETYDPMTDEGAVHEREAARGVIDRLQSEHKAALEDRDRRLASLLSEVSALKARTDTDAALIEDRDRRLEDRIRQNEELAAPITELEEDADHSAMSRRILTLEGELAERDAEISELKSARKREGTPEQGSPPAPPETEKAVTPPKANGELKLEAVRDGIRAKFDAGEEFTTTDVIVKLELGDIPRSTLSDRIRTLTESGFLKRTGGERGPSVRWQWTRPSSNGQPTSRPRGEPHIPQPDAPKRTSQIGGTGKPTGPASKPGALKQQQARAAAGGARVKPRRVGGVRV